MNIPKQIVGENKIRDFEICRLYIEGFLPEEIAQQRNYEISTRRVQQIISVNSAFVNPRVEWPKSKRIHLRQYLILQKLRGKKGRSKKDVLDHLNGLRDEVYGDKPLVDNSQHTHYTIHSLTKEIANAVDERVRNSTPGIISEPALVLSESLKSASVVQANGDHDGTQGQSEGNGKVV